MNNSFKHLDISALPDGWSADFLGNLVDFKLGKTPPRGNPAYWKNGRYHWVSISDMTPYGEVTETAEKVSQEAYDTVLRGKIVSEGSWLMSFKLTIGRLSRLGVPAFHNEAIISFQPDKEVINDEYLCYYLSQINFKDYQDTAIKGQTLNKGKLNSLEIALPPLTEQKTIAHILSTVRRAIAAQEKIIQTTTELKKTLMHKLFTEGLHNEPHKQTEIGPIPQSWKVVEFEQLAVLQRGKDLTKAQFRSGDTPVAGSNGLIGFHDTPNCPGPSVTVGRSGSVGRVIYYEKDFWAHNTSLYVRDFKGNLPRFVAYFLEHLDLARFKTGASVPTLDRNSFRTMPVAVPPIDEQGEIASALVAIDKKIERAISNEESYQDLFHTLLHSLMMANILAI